MSLPKYSELKLILILDEIKKEIFLTQKNLFELRMKKSKSQSPLPHLFIHKKHQLAQLKFYENTITPKKKYIFSNKKKKL